MVCGGREFIVCVPKFGGCNMDMVEVQKVLDMIRPNLQADGGDIELVNVKDGVVSVKLVGHCAG